MHKSLLVYEVPTEGVSMWRLKNNGRCWVWASIARGKIKIYHTALNLPRWILSGIHKIVIKECVKKGSNSCGQTRYKYMTIGDRKGGELDVSGCFIYWTAALMQQRQDFYYYFIDEWAVPLGEQTRLVGERARVFTFYSQIHLLWIM